MATVEPQSDRSSQTAVWNSSSRCPRGSSRNASYAMRLIMPVPAGHPDTTSLGAMFGPISVAKA